VIQGGSSEQGWETVSSSYWSDLPMQFISKVHNFYISVLLPTLARNYDSARQIYFSVTNFTAFLVNVDAEMSTNSTHGAYDWVPNFFKINYINSNMTMDAIKDRYGNLTIVERVEEVMMFSVSEKRKNLTL